MNTLKRLWLNQELARLTAQRNKHQIILDGIKQYFGDSSHAITGKDSMQLLVAKHNVDTYENLIADIEAKLLILDCNLIVQK